MNHAVLAWGEPSVVIFAAPKLQPVSWTFPRSMPDLATSTFSDIGDERIGHNVEEEAALLGDPLQLLDLRRMGRALLRASAIPAAA